MKNITLLGSTGSIGINTLAVLDQYRHDYNVVALVAGQNVALMAEQCRRFTPRYAAMADSASAAALRLLINQANLKTEVLHGAKAACELAALSEVDQVMAAIVGVAGLLPTMAAVRAGKRVLLANKESLVTCGRLFMQMLKEHNAELIPVDSEHNAIFQCLPVAAQQQLGHMDLVQQGIRSLILTASGGPFYTATAEQLATVTPEQACGHPNWSMGRKISVDSATMMNKGLEYVEARWLFNAQAEQVEVVIHPQSVVHSMVRYCDGSVMAQLGSPDMRTPIAHALAWPQRINTQVAKLDFTQHGTLTFCAPDLEQFPCLKLAIDACQQGQVATTALNAANEVAVAAFLQNRLRFIDIAVVNQAVVDAIHCEEPRHVEAVLEIDTLAREIATKNILRVAK